MASVGGRRNRAVVVLKVDRKRLYNKLKPYGWGASYVGQTDAPSSCCQSLGERRVSGGESSRK